MKKGKFNQLSFEERFWLRASTPSSICWEWQGYIGSRGYGYIKRNYKTLLAHRVSYELYNKVELTSDQCVCHRCDNPKCVNPGHLFIGSHADNAADRNRKGREAHPTGIKHPMAKLAEADVLAIRSSSLKGKTLAEIYGVTPSTISRIKAGKGWPHVQSNYRAMAKVA